MGYISLLSYSVTYLLTYLLTGEDLSRHLNKIESIGLRKA